jgi:membrane protein DedA with SNARE-associated domain
MALTQWLADYGYLAVFVACLLEGETVLVLAGFAAHQGHLSLPVVVAIAFVGGTLGDQLFYWIGRTWGAALLDRFPRLDLRRQRVVGLLKRHDAILIFGIRFMYGLRIVGPIAMGAAGVPARRFALFNVLGAALWAPLVGGAGYLFGDALEALLGDVTHYEQTALLLVAVAVLLLSLVRAWLGARAKRDAPEP